MGYVDVITAGGFDEELTITTEGVPSEIVIERLPKSLRAKTLGGIMYMVSAPVGATPGSFAFTIKTHGLQAEIARRSASLWSFADQFPFQSATADNAIVFSAMQERNPNRNLHDPLHTMQSRTELDLCFLHLRRKQASRRLIRSCQFPRIRSENCKRP